MISRQFFSHLKLLRDKYEEPSQYNLFSVLRSYSDEVRLHSRFLVDVLNPSGSHNQGERFLTDFLKRQGIEIAGDIEVLCEYKNIDILIRSEKTAVIIENKIYATDQDKQLQRYYQTMRDEGYKDIHLFYLTLDGKEPSPESVGNLDKKITNISYRSDIHDWIDRCTELSARNAPLREAFIQYLDLISHLTNRVENMEHIEKLKKLLLEDDNLESVSELNQAYEEIVVDAQLSMWEMLGEKMTEQLGELSNDSIALEHDPRETVRKYVQARRNSRWITQEFELRDYPSFYLYVQQDHHLYFGLYQNEKSKHAKKTKIPKLKHDYAREEDDTFYAYPTRNINFRNLSADDVKYLSNPQSLNEFTQQIVDELVKMHRMIMQA
ncbi:PD-(D/E)XK nuclease family protein [Vibrio rhodolitus]|uniref:PDDEXK-like family protein n=1 Tax=Vibrio rhodolitus TaxID=2231649 RepID=UPI000E0AA4D3|nr:PD-(D/E)XK nuclease family protein [Vibrio rhodolitus]